ncbi:MAG: succinyl-diaminopimelate desuccinylase [Pseudomonadota bacterium]
MSDPTNPAELAQALIQKPSVTPADAGALDTLQIALKTLGFQCHRLPFEEDGAARVDNLYARIGDSAPHFCFAGHTDVVPAGALDEWSVDPFAGTIKDNQLWGRGAADMKSAIAAFAVAAGRHLNGAKTPARGSISMLITGDEEGEAINGTKKMLQWLADRGETIDQCVVGEPTNPSALGDMVKVGRRGSLNGWITVRGRQGHVAYPHRADNPIPKLLRKLLLLSEHALDEGYEFFQPSNLEITDIHIGNPAHNVIPERATARFNVRFNPNWTGESLNAWLRARLDATAKDIDAIYELKTIVSGEAFLTPPSLFIDNLQDIVERHCGNRPELSTTGGTSDARFIKDYAPVVEFGLVGATMHKVDEHVAVQDIETLADIYTDILKVYFETA